MIRTNVDYNIESVIYFDDGSWFKMLERERSHNTALAYQIKYRVLVLVTTICKGDPKMIIIFTGFKIFFNLQINKQSTKPDLS